MANSNFIPINTNQRLGADLRRTVDQVRATVEQLKRLEEIMVQQVSGTDYSEVEVQFGTPTGEGQTVYNLLAAAYASMNNADITQFVSWLG